MKNQDLSIDKELIRGHIDTILLNLLMEQDRYGYEMYREVLTRSDGEYELKEPSLYSAIRRLEGQNLIEGYWGEETQGGRRKYYHITAEGKDYTIRAREAWITAKRILDKLTGVPQ